MKTVDSGDSQSFLSRFSDYSIWKNRAGLRLSLFLFMLVFFALILFLFSFLFLILWDFTTTKSDLEREIGCEPVYVIRNRPGNIQDICMEISLS